MSLSQLAESLRETALAGMREASSSCLFLSASDLHSRAVTRHAPCSGSCEEAWRAALSLLEEALGGKEPVILRADWVVHQERVSWARAQKAVRAERRNYFRWGISFGEDWSLPLTEQELNGHAVLYSGGDEPKGRFHEKNAEALCRRRFGRGLPSLRPEDGVLLFTVKGAFCEKGGPVRLLRERGFGAGLREHEADASTLRACIASGASWLARNCGADGRFHYGFFPCFGRDIPTYNTLRHISSTWAMLDAWRLSREKALLEAVERSLACLLRDFARTVRLPGGEEAMFFEDIESGELKLGSSGVALLLFSAYTKLVHPLRYVPLMKAVARGILHMQNEEGGFVHVLNRDLSVKDPFRIVYYDGEAVFGLLRLYDLTRDAAYLEAAERAFGHFLRKDYWKNHDHWLSYSVNELTRWKPEARYFEFGIRNFEGYLPFVLKRETAYPTLLELMMAADLLLRRMDAMPEMHGLLARVDRAAFDEALEHRAAHLLNSFFWPETAMFFKEPGRIAGSFFTRHHAFRTRIDDVEHFVSGLLACLEHRRGWTPNRLSVRLLTPAKAAKQGR